MCKTTYLSPVCAMTMNIAYLALFKTSGVKLCNFVVEESCCSRILKHKNNRRIMNYINAQFGEEV